MFRGDATTYATDDAALSICQSGLARGLLKELGVDHHIFFIMPLMHSEDLGVQEECVRQFENLDRLTKDRGEQAIALVKGTLSYAKRHRDIVARFGRFPHRNEILLRTSTAEEKAFLTEPGSSF